MNPAGPVDSTTSIDDPDFQHSDSWWSSIWGGSAREKRTIIFLWLFSFFLGVAIVSYETAVTSLFLGAFGVESLPFVYIGVAVTGVVLGSGYLSLRRFFPTYSLFRLTILGILGGLIGFRLLLEVSDSRWAYLAAMIWVDVLAVFMTMQFWALAGILLNVRQAKRLFGIVGSGEVAGLVIGGMCLPLMVPIVGLLDLIWISAACVLGCLFLVPAFRSQSLSNGAEEKTVVAGGFSFRKMFRDRYAVLILGVSLTSVGADYFLDFLFYSSLTAALASPLDLAAFLGPFFAFAGTLAFAVKILMFNRLIARFGLLGGLLILPGLLLLALAASLGFLYSGLGATAVVGFSGFGLLVMLAKLLDLSLRVSLFEPAQQILYQPVPREQRMELQAFNEGVCEPASNGFAGLVLVLLSSVLAFADTDIAWLALAWVSLWCGAAIAIDGAYGRRLMGGVRRRRIWADTGEFECPPKLLHECLQSTNDAEVVYALHLLAKNRNRSMAEESLCELFEHRNADVRIEAMKAAVDIGDDLAKLRVEELLCGAPGMEPEVLAQVIVTYCALAGEAGVEQAQRFLEHDSTQVSEAATIGLMRYGGSAGGEAAGKTLRVRIESDAASDRVRGARLIGRIGADSFTPALRNLFRDQDVEVRRCAILAAGELGNPIVLPELIGRLDDEELRSAVQQSIGRFGASALPAIQAHVSGDSLAPERRGELLRVIGKISAPESVVVLRAFLRDENPGLRGQALKGLLRCDYRAQGEACRELIALIDLELESLNLNADESWAWRSSTLLNHVFTSARHAGFHRLCDALILRGVSASAVAGARVRLVADDAAENALGVEILEKVLRGRLRKRVVTCLDTLFEESSDPVEPRELLPIADRDGEADGGILDAAVIHSKWLEGKEPCEFSAPPDPAKRIVAEAHRLWFDRGDLSDALECLIHKLFVLASVDLFGTAQPSELITFADRLEVRTAVAGDSLIESDDSSESMYLVVSGRISGKSERIAEEGSVLGFDTAFVMSPPGEALVLSDEAVAYEFSAHDLFECMRSVPSVARGVMRHVCRELCAEEGHSPISAVPPPVESDFELRGGENADAFSVSEKSRSLVSIPMFSGLDHEDLGRVASIIVVSFADAGDMIIREGDGGESLFVVVQGGVEVLRAGEKLSEFGVGDFFGELAALAPSPRTATVNARSETILFRISGAELYELFDEYPEIMRSVLMGLCLEWQRRIPVSPSLQKP